MVSFRHVRAALAILLVCLWPASAMAQAAAPAAEVAAAASEVDGDYASAMAADCTTACAALDSMRRATERLCTLDAGDRCASARQKLEAATAHVRASCPACGGELRDEAASKGGGAAPSPPKEAPAPPTVNAAEEAQVSKRGGCAGCATSSPGEGDLVPLGGVVMGMLAMRRRRRR
jgi:MYXO-CTERM domain-containing protein